MTCAQPESTLPGLSPMHTSFVVIAMAGVKRSRKGSSADQDFTNDSPYLPMFDIFRSELDEHHDRRERVTKSSRDITAQSKKM